MSSAATAMRAVTPIWAAASRIWETTGTTWSLPALPWRAEPGATDERDDSGHRLIWNAWAIWGGLVDIHLDELEGTRVLARDILQHGQRRLRFEQSATTT